MTHWVLRHVHGLLRVHSSLGHTSLRHSIGLLHHLSLSTLRMRSVIRVGLSGLVVLRSGVVSLSNSSLSSWVRSSLSGKLSLWHLLSLLIRSLHLTDHVHEIGVGLEEHLQHLHNLLNVHVLWTSSRHGSSLKSLKCFLVFLFLLLHLSN